MLSSWSLVLLSLLGSLSVTQSRPRDRSHGGHINDKTVPFVDKPYESGAMFGEYWNHLGNKEIPALPKVTSNYDELYDKYNQEHGRVIGDGAVDSDKVKEEVKPKEDKTNEEGAADKKEVDVSALPVEGGVEDMASGLQSKVKDAVKDEGQIRHRRHRKKGEGKRHGKKSKNSKKGKKKNSVKKEIKETGTEIEQVEFNFEKYFQEHPDFQKNVATISDKLEQSEVKPGPEAALTPTTDALVTEKANNRIPGEENQPMDNDNEHVDDDISDDSDDDKVMSEGEKAKLQADGKLGVDDGQDSQSNDISSEAYKEYDYYDEEDDSSYSSSEIEAEKNAQAPYDLFKKFEQMLGDQPQAEAPHADQTTETNQTTEDKDKKSDNKTQVVNTDAVNKSTNIPKTDMAPSTSPNPPTPRKYVKSAVTQPVNPQWRRRTDTWNYIESKPVEACKETPDCSAGRMCMFGLCLCGRPDFCDGHSKPVCGSDGRLYPSHCELHRTACVLGIHIRIDYTSRCITPAETGIMSSHMSKASNIGGQQVLDCKVTLPKEYKARYVIQWEKDDLDGLVFLQYAGFAPHIHERYNGRVQLINGFSLELSDIQATDEGWYQCQLILLDDASKGNSSWVFLTVHKETKPILPIDIETEKDDNVTEAVSVKPSTPNTVAKAEATDANTSKPTAEEKTVAEVETTVADVATVVAEVKVTTEAQIIEKTQQINDPNKDQNQVQNIQLKDEVIAGSVAAKVGKDSTVDHVVLPEKQSSETAKDEVKSVSGGGLKNNANADVKDDFDIDGDVDNDDEDFNEADDDNNTLDEWDDSEIYDDYEDSQELDLSDEDSYDEDDKEADNVDENNQTSKDKPSLVPLFCTPDLYMKFMADVLQYHCIYFEEKHCDRQTREEKQRLAAVMFNYFDRNYNGRIEKEELWEMQLLESIDQLSSVCTLLDIVVFDELGTRDGKLSSDEFIQAFDIPDLIEHRTDVVPLLATVGNGLEVKCDVTESMDIIWKRNDMDLSVVSFPGVTVLDDGSLYIETIGFQHVGNLTCHDRRKPSVRQIHMLTVQKPPHVVVAPVSKTTVEGRDLVIKCHAEGYPTPTIEWTFGGAILEHGTKYRIQNSDKSLTVMSVSLADGGQYKCVGHNRAGTAERVVDITILPSNDSAQQVESPEETFVIFHDEGYTMHEPNQCLTQRHVKPDFGNFFFIPDELDAPPALCEAGKPCSWGGAVNVMDRFVYASQPRQNRIVVIDVKDTFNPNQVIFTDHMPVSLQYVAHLDEVWVLCWNGEEDNGSKTVIIIRNASQQTQHHAVHTQPIGNRFDLVQDIFLPSDSYLHHPYKFGYTVHNGQQGLFKVDLVQKKYLKAVDFTSYDCVPTTLAFVPLGGHVLVQCVQKTLQGEVNMILELDYVTDTVTSNMTMPGTPYVSPDSGNVAIVNKATGKVTVFQVLESGEIVHQFEVTVGSEVSDVTFHKAGFTEGYELYMTSAEGPTLYSVSLLNGKVETVKDIGEPDSAVTEPWFRKSRPLVSGDVFSDYLASTALSSLVILSGKHHNIQCDFRDLEHPAVITFSHLNKN